MKKRQVFLLLLIGIFFLGIIFYIKNYSKEIKINVKKLPLIGNDRVIEKEENVFCQENCSPISGIGCENYNRRPVMVMLSADEEVRPLSGLEAADMIIEMPVVTGGINRFAAVYICDLPEEIGSVRSARHDFIPLAKGFDAVLAHWGGSHFALDELNNGVIDNLDALSNPFNVFYRKQGIYAPHNGFTSGSRILNSMQKLGHRLEGELEKYSHFAKEDDLVGIDAADELVIINYPSVFKVDYKYDKEKKAYLRIRNNKEEQEALSGEDIYAKIVLVIEASSRQIEGQYNDVDIVGSGDLQVFQGGKRIDGRWEKKSYDSKLYFFDKNKKEIKFLQGQVWAQIIEPEANIY